MQNLFKRERYDNNKCTKMEMTIFERYEKLKHYYTKLWGPLWPKSHNGLFTSLTTALISGAMHTKIYLKRHAYTAVCIYLYDA